MSARWSEPVRVEMGGVVYVVFDTTRATELLLLEWPNRHDERHHAAQAAILRAMRNPENHDLAEQSRIAFAVAAGHAGMLAGDKIRAVVKYGYQLIDTDGSETFTSNRRLAESLSRQGWMVVGYVALPVSATDAMVCAASNELALILQPEIRQNLPAAAMRRVLNAALAEINAG